jgi:hypothetical protein
MRVARRYAPETRVEINGELDFESVVEDFAVLER